MPDIERIELEELRLFKKRTEEHMEEVDKLLKYTGEMQLLTGYTSGAKPNFQLLRIWILRVQGKWKW